MAVLQRLDWVSHWLAMAVVVAILLQQRVPAIGSIFRVIVGMAAAGFVHRALAWAPAAWLRILVNLQFLSAPHNGITGFAGNQPAEACAPAVPVVWRTGLVLGTGASSDTFLCEFSR